MIMVDKFPKETRSRIMSKIKGKDTKPEIKLRKSLFSDGYRYRTNKWFLIEGCRFKPDMTFPSKKAVIFIDGCFWHKCPSCFKRPMSNKKYWDKKIKDNIDRDKRQNRLLRKNGWLVIRVWEHEVNNDLKKVKKVIISRLKQN